jgi:hypothetical protein
VELGEKLASAGMSQRLARRVIEEAAKFPEKKLEQVLDEIKEEPHELVFEPSDIEPVLQGVKVQMISRTAPNPKVKAGVSVQASVYVPHFADLRIESVERKRLRYFDEEDAKKEGYHGLTEFKQAWKKKHGEWNEDELVYIVHFQKI